MNTSQFIQVNKRRLFTHTYKSRSALIRKSAVLLLKSGPYEDDNCENQFRFLSQHLTGQGFECFTFDYFGTGDSEGFTGEGNIDMWIQDTLSYIDYLSHEKAINNLQIVAYGLGALVASMVTRQYSPYNLILWNPVLDGKRYLDRFKKKDEPSLLQSLKAQENPSDPEGFPFSESQQESIRGLSWQKIVPQVPHAHIITDENLVQKRSFKICLQLV